MKAYYAKEGTRVWRKDEMEVMELVTAPIWVWDNINCHVWWANTEACKMWNADSRESLYARDMEPVSESTMTRNILTLKKLARGESVEDQWTIYPEAAEPVQMRFTSCPIYIDDGRLATLALGTRVQGDNSALRSVESLRHLPVAVERISQGDSVVKEQNPHAEQVFGEKTDGSSFFVDRFEDETVARAVTAGKRVSVEARLRTVTDGMRWFSIDGREALDPVTGERDVVASAVDVHDRKLAEFALQKAKDEAELANKTKSKFFAVMTHEIRTPLNSVIGHADLLAETSLDETQKQYLNSLTTSGLALMGIVNDILDLSKLEAGKMKFERVEFDVESVVESSLTQVGPDARRREIDLSRLQPSSALPPKLLGDPYRLRQILLNYLSNAIKFTLPGGSVTISTKVVKQDEKEVCLRFEVVDTGIGISAEHQDKLFSTFSQAHESVAREYGGTGLGLSIINRFADSLGGKVGVASTLGKGSTFWVQIPFDVVQPEEPKTETQGRKCVPPSLDNDASIAPLKVLVVDDTKCNVFLLTKYLQKLGHSYAVAYDGLEAINSLRDDPSFDLCFMDRQMPNLDGIEATRRIRQELGLTAENLPIIGLTADFRESDLHTYLDVGMNDCLGKPCRLSDIRTVIAKVVSPNEGKEHDEIDDSGSNSVTPPTSESNFRVDDARSHPFPRGVTP